MRLPAVIALALLPAAVSAQVVTDMTPERVKEAIADEKNAGCYPLQKSGAMGQRKYGLGCFTTPYSRVALAAQAARKKYQPFTEAEVTPAMLEPRVEVIAVPQNRLFSGPGMASVEAVVIAPQKSKDRTAVIQPTGQQDVDSEYQNRLGATFEGRGIVASFPLSALSEANEVRIVFDGQACSDWKNKPSSECAVGLKVKGVR